MMRSIILCIVLFLSGCGTLNEKYVAADRADYDVWKPIIERWLALEPGVAVDPTTDDVVQYIEMLHIKLQLRGARIEAAERLLQDE